MELFCIDNFLSNNSVSDCLYPRVSDCLYPLILLVVDLVSPFKFYKSERQKKLLFFIWLLEKLIMCYNLLIFFWQVSISYVFAHFGKYFLFPLCWFVKTHVYMCMCIHYVYYTEYLYIAYCTEHFMSISGS